MEILDFILNAIRAKGEYNDPSQSFVSSDLFDSFEFITLLSQLEAQFGVEIDISEYEPEYFTTAAGLADIISKLAQK